MTIRHIAPIATCALALAFVVAGMTGLAGQQYEVPRTAWGDPDLQGVWNNNTVVPLQRPDQVGDRETLSDEEVAARRQASSDALFAEREGDTGFYNEFWFEYGVDTNRTSLITNPADGKLPALTPAAEQRAKELMAVRMRSTQAPDHYLEMSAYDRCISRGMPGAMMPGFYNHNYHILQTENYVALVVEMIHDARIIPLDGRDHAPSGIQQWLGDSRGRWEGDTLVVETTNLTEKLDERGLFIPTVFASGANQRLVERFTRVSEDIIDYRFTVEDPTVFTGEWTAAIPFNRFDGVLFEYACHEGNYAMPNMLAGARATEAAAAAGGVQ